MRLTYFPSKDATIYAELPTKNTGFDEILEVGKSVDGRYATRAMLAFDVTDISASLANGTIPSNASFELKLGLAHAQNLKSQQGIEFITVSETWTEGTGAYVQDTIQDTDGVTWVTRDGTVDWTVPGNASGSFVTAVSASKMIGDFTADLTAQVALWVSGSVSNNGILLKFPNTDEVDTKNLGLIKFFSSNTHTIYAPTLTAKWNSQVYNTGSLLPPPVSSLFAAPSTLQTEYRPGEVVRVDVAARPNVPAKTFSSQSLGYQGRMYLPQTSYYSIIDDMSGTVIVPFDDSSRINCDSTGPYFIFRVEHMYPERYYRVRLAVRHAGLYQVFDNGYIFKVTV
jgi:hypothetical protein